MVSFRTAAAKINIIIMTLVIAADSIPAAAAEWRNGVIKDEGAIELNLISVTAEKLYDPVAEPTAVPLNNKTFTESIGRKTIELRNPFTATELISFISPSVLRNNQNRKYKSFFDIRGARASLILDGFVVQDGSSNSGIRGDDRLLEFLNPDIIESVDIMKDSTALIYGGAKGGTIYIKTRRPGKKHNRLKLELGSFGEFTTKLSFTDTIDNSSSYFAAFNFRNFDGPDGKNAAFKDAGTFVKYFYSPSERDELVISCNAVNGMYQIPIDEPWASGQLGTVLGSDPKTYSIVIDPRYGWSYDPWRSVFADLNYTRKWNARRSTNFQLSRLETTNDFQNPRGAGTQPLGPIDGHRVFETTGFMAVRHTVKTGGGAIYRTGYSIERWYNPTGKLYWENMNNEDKKHTAYIQAEVPVSGEDLIWDAGFRRDHRYIIREQKSRVPTGKALEPITNRWEDPRNSFSTGLTWKATGNDTLSLRYASLATTPVDRGATQNGAELADEIDKIINLGVEHKFKNTFRPVSVELNIFKNDMKNSIIEDGTKFIDAAKTTVMRVFKNADTVSRGGELKFNARLSRLFDLSIGTGLISYSPEVTAKPRKNHVAELKYANERAGVSASLYGRFVGGFDSEASYTFKGASNKTVTQTLAGYRLGDFWDLDFSVSKKLTPNDPYAPKLSLTVRNLLDKKYETMPFAPDFGRRASLGIEMEF